MLKLQLFTKYLRLTVVFMWKSALREKFNFFFLLLLTKFSFWQEDLALGYYSMKFEDFLDISLFPKILSLRSFGNSWGNS